MAVALTGAIYKALEFDNVSSRTYGVYITGEAVYNAPQRDVEMITIPARNGAFALDNGRFENIEVSYPAGIFADTEADFIQAISDFRNFLCSRKGYVRLQDEYNPDEYRMAVYKSGLDVTPAMLRAGEFTITFDCKPQRWLKSGETAVAYSNNDTITNPTLFDAEPLLAIKGYGTIGFNGYEIELENAVLGHILIENSKSNIQISHSGNDINLNLNQLNNGDTITLESADVIWKYRASSGSFLKTWTIDSNTGITGSGAYKLEHIENQLGVGITIPSLTFAKGTSSSYTNTTVLSGTRYDLSTYTAQLVLTIGYDGASTIKVQYAFTYSSAQIVTMTGASKLSYGDVTGESTQSQLGNPTYIDCELGDAYKIVSDEYVSLNSNVDLGSDLPKLAPGSNTVTYDNTVTELKITPRWWKV